ncbi:hypothetical protein [Gloeothece verrucosa]|uniref:Uncharacterized protein n=1 Tax=Gloeothece verrucosa (strain PCC 7822) TaxID=497965 RepID=E0UIL2_GLOV7|nr:hypothetical protein [Gloeothece verrucosa]ADN12206.1 hypothetical protein Cyan7822_0155 [Gloeothece verrucosa PCC 7822]
MKKLLLFVLLIAGILLLTAPATAKQLPSQNLHYTCPAVNSQGLAEDGKCLNPPHQSEIETPTPMFSLEQENLVHQYQEILALVKISLSDEQCEQQPGLILYGYYDRIDNLMVICKDAMKHYQEYVETLVHESWHAVQDCIDGLDNPDTTAFLTQDPELLTTILNGLSPAQVENILHNYEKADQAFEVEAFFLQKYPHLVLKGLNTCVSQMTSG